MEMSLHNLNLENVICVEKDEAKAFEYFNNDKLAGKYVNYHLILGSLYENGEGTEMDFENYNKAAEIGNKLALDILSNFYKLGININNKMYKEAKNEFKLKLIN